jgi:hypothetical protein
MHSLLLAGVVCFALARAQRQLDPAALEPPESADFTFTFSETFGDNMVRILQEGFHGFAVGNEAPLLTLEGGR